MAQESGSNGEATCCILSLKWISLDGGGLSLSFCLIALRGQGMERTGKAEGWKVKPTKTGNV